MHARSARHRTRTYVERHVPSREKKRERARLEARHITWLPPRPAVRRGRGLLPCQGDECVPQRAGRPAAAVCARQWACAGAEGMARCPASSYAGASRVVPGPGGTADASCAAPGVVSTDASGLCAHGVCGVCAQNSAGAYAGGLAPAG